MSLAAWTGIDWLGLVPIILLAVFFVIPAILKQHRFLASLACPHCNQAAGRYFTRRGRLHLRCQHCGQETPTDCIMPYAAGPPFKA